jgi:hypothetical protein
MFCLLRLFSTYSITHTLSFLLSLSTLHTHIHHSGFEWRTRTYDLVSWDDNFQNLVKFGTENQHYNVPSPMDVSNNDEGAAGGGGTTTTTQEQEEAIRFYKWVKRTRAEYKSLMDGKTSRMLTEDRVAKLRQIGFIV